MNDPKEGRTLYDYLCSESDIGSYLKDILDKRGELLTSSATYLASFTRSSDRLDLWRAYGGDGNGFCISVHIKPSNTHSWSQASTIEEGFSLDHLSSLTLYNVQYEEEQKENFYQEITKALTPIYELTSDYPTELKEAVKSVVYSLLSEVVYLFKDEQYSSEREVRIFQQLNLESVSIDESEIGKLYCTTAPILFNSPQSEIIIGPKVADKRQVELSIKKRLQIHGFPAKVTHSAIAYR